MSGIIKSFFFGFIASAICCYKGYVTTHGTRGVGLATTQAVVISFISILISDYFLTVLLYNHA
jgi:phospholipid/cholesterol/gamma-HCH transport system permease protein